jgi:4'-phosphopantetheinyl transferase
LLTPADTNPDFTRPRADIWIIDSGRFADSAETLRGIITPDELTRYERFACRQTALTWLTARAGLRFLLGRYLDLPARDLVIHTSENGKPFVENMYDLYFNVSHSANIVVIAMTGWAVGIDVENLNRRVDSAAVLRRFFSPTEQANCAENMLLDAPKTFFRGWTRKEAVLKATGEGIAGLAHNEINFAPGLTRAMLSYRGSQEAANSWFFYEFEPAQGYIAALACQSPALAISEKWLQPASLSD